MFQLQFKNRMNNKILAIAITDYDDKKLNNLSNCKNDLENILKILTNKYQFDDIDFIFEKIDTTRKSLFNKLKFYFSNCLENENVLSKSHAQQIVNEFFKKNTPQKFSIIHQGGKGDSNYAIGTLETQNGKFRIYFLLKTVNQVSFIHQLRIEKQNE